MLNQSFSLETFKEIFDKENRKGVNVEKVFQNDFSKSLDQLILLKGNLIEIQKESDKEIKSALLIKRKELKKERDFLLEEVIRESANGLNKSIETLELILGPVIGKQTYTLEQTLSNFFMSKKVQSNIVKTYKVIQGNRYAILNRFINLLEDEVPKYILRVDISKFYESIPQKDLLDKINNDYLLSVLSKKFINRIFKEFNRFTGQLGLSNPIGIPRGVGISPYLSEIFMRPVDQEIQEINDIIYYERYVDDIIIIIVPERADKSKVELKNYLNQVSESITSKGLSINFSKTKEFDLLNSFESIMARVEEFSDGELKKRYKPVKDKSFQFLGYNFGSIKSIKVDTEKDETKEKFSLNVRLSDNKINRYKNKIKLAFKDYKIKSQKGSTSAFALLRSRIEFLTSNTRLRNNKSQVLIGIFYSNPFVNDDSCFEELDRSLVYYISRSGLEEKRKKELRKFSFKVGFYTKKFVLYPITKRKYKNYNSKTNDTVNRINKGIIQFGLKEINAIWKS